jgi:hypothetical protein
MSDIIGQFPPANMGFQRNASAKVVHNGGIQPTTIFTAPFSVAEGDLIRFTCAVTSRSVGEHDIQGIAPGGLVNLGTGTGTLTGDYTIDEGITGSTFRFMSPTNEVVEFSSMLVERITE